MTRFLNHLRFDNRALIELPLDKTRILGSRKVPNACFSLVDPTPVDNPQLVAWSTGSLDLLDIKQKHDSNPQPLYEELSQYFSGNMILKGSKPAAHCYCGHQFGYFSGQLGDGAAIYLGEILNAEGDRWELQLKGAGKTPFSRNSDGRKVLRSSIREFLCSEAMHYLRIPTTRAGTVITSNSQVVRSMFYDGNEKMEPCAVLLRISPTFLRFGSFEIFKSTDPYTQKEGPSKGNVEMLHTLLDFTLKSYYPHIQHQLQVDRYTEFYRELCVKTADLVANWQCVGFCHGVLNTDNMSILGLTLDYGPFGFMENYNPDHICNSSDDNGRYTFVNQPTICLWNLKKFAEAIEDALPLEISTKILKETYQQRFDEQYLKGMRSKLGLFKTENSDKELVEDLFNTMQETHSDFTNTFLALSTIDLPSVDNHSDSCIRAKHLLENCTLHIEDVKTFVKPTMDEESIKMLQVLFRNDPRLTSKMGDINETISKEMKKVEKFDRLQIMEQSEWMKFIADKWCDWIGRFVERLRREVSDETDVVGLNQKRKLIMQRHNPRFILRNYIAQVAIEEAEKGNFDEVRNVLKRLEGPFDVDDEDRPLISCHGVRYDALPSSDQLFIKIS